MFKSTLFSILALSVVASASTAEAGTKKIKLDVNEFEADGNFAVPELGFSVTISDAGPGIVSVPFVLPANYKTNSTLTVKMNYAIEDTGCNVMAGAVAVLRARKGKLPSVLDYADVGSGISTVGGLVFAAPAVAGSVASRTMKVERPTAGNILTQKAGDTVTLVFARVGIAADDTCTSSLAVTGATIIYETN